MAENGDFKILQLCLEAPNIKIPQTESMQKILKVAFNKNNIEVFKKLIHLGINPFDTRGGSEEPLMTAIIASGREDFFDCCMESSHYKPNCNVPSLLSQTLKAKNIELFKKLIVKGENPMKHGHSFRTIFEDLILDKEESLAIFCLQHCTQAAFYGINKSSLLEKAFQQNLREIFKQIFLHPILTDDLVLCQA